MLVICVVRFVPATTTLEKLPIAPFKIALLFKSKSAVIVLGELPSLERVLLNAVFSPAKFPFNCVVEAYPELIVVMEACLAILVYPL